MDIKTITYSYLLIFFISVCDLLLHIITNSTNKCPCISNPIISSHLFSIVKYSPPELVEQLRQRSGWAKSRSLG